MADIDGSDSEAFRKLYAVGNVIDLSIRSEDGETFQTISVKVLALHQPFTLSCVLTVEVEGKDIGLSSPPPPPPPPPSFSSSSLSSSPKLVKAILKLYDRRFAAQLRKDEGVDPWNETTEHSFLELVQTGHAAEFVRRLGEEEDFKEPDEGWSGAENEVYLWNECWEMFATEMKAYRILDGLQGKQVPRLYGRVGIGLGGREGLESDLQPFLDVNGVLLESISGPTISGMLDDDRVPRWSWQSVVDQAVQIVRDYSQLGILNRDVRPSNFVVNDAVPDGDEHRVVMLDFALCRFRQPGESDAEWGRKKWCQDEEGAVGAVMKTRMARCGFELEYKKSNQWIERAPGEDDE